MRFPNAVTATLVAPIVIAQNAPIPRIFGMPKELRSRSPFLGLQHVGVPMEVPKLAARQGGDAQNRCGADGGGASCDAGYCCSAAGYCGNTSEYCNAPDCQIDFGPGCDANKTPAGTSTRNDARPQLGAIAYGGVGVRQCLKPRTVAITYDDGPYSYTQELLELLDQYSAKATFFVVGNNLGKGAIDETESWRSVIRNMDSKGHQIASHTWSHQNLDSITSEQRYDQMVKNEMAIRNIIGKYPTYMRPPYSACDTTGCQADLQALGYVITSFDLDTDDYNNLTPAGMEIAKENFKNGIDTALPDGDRLAIAHDIHELTVRNLTPYMLEYVYNNNWTAVTVGECMNDPPENWYRASIVTPNYPTSTDGSCGPNNGLGQSCIGYVGSNGTLEECCSQYGTCGSSNDFCGASCDPEYGLCSTPPPNSTSSDVLSPTTSDYIISETPTYEPEPSTSGNATITIPMSESMVSETSTPTYDDDDDDDTMTMSMSSTPPDDEPTSTALPISTDGNCGPDFGVTCAGFVQENGEAGPCCSQYGYCGASDAYCGASCQPLYGECGSSEPEPSSMSMEPSATPTPDYPEYPQGGVSTDGKCGPDNGGQTCNGYRNAWGWQVECCSKVTGLCSTDPWSCAVGCDKNYGTCWFTF